MELYIAGVTLLLIAATWGLVLLVDRLRVRS